MLKPPMSKFYSDLSVRLRDIAEKQVPAKLKPMVDERNTIAFQLLLQPWYYRSYS